MHARWARVLTINNRKYEKEKHPPSTHMFKTIARTKINNVKLYFKKYCLRSNNDVVLFYEVKATDGSYFKTPDEAAAKGRFEWLKEFEKRQLIIN